MYLFEKGIDVVEKEKKQVSRAARKRAILLRMQKQIDRRAPLMIFTTKKEEPKK